MTDTALQSPLPGGQPAVIAVVDDDPDILELVSIHLVKTGMRAETFPDAAHLYRFLQKQVPDLVVLDLMLPDSDGIEICRYLRADKRLSAVPVIMLTAKADEVDRVLGLEIGADDYVTKPFSTKELIARVKSVLRRSRHQENPERVEVGSLVIDSGRYEVLVAGDPVPLTTVEFRLLRLLASRAGRVFSREVILDHLWGHEKAVTDRTVDVHVRHLREKLGSAAHLIKNVRGVGYKLEP